MKFWSLLLPVGLTLCASQAFGGALAGAGAKWGAFAVRPEASEATPNYYGYGLGVTVGYSFRQVFDVATFVHYVPARLNDAQLGAEDAQFYAYGGEIAARFSESVYFALRGGAGHYKLLNEKRLTAGDEVKGTWEGPALGLSVGAIHRVNKGHFFQTSLDMMHVITEDIDGDVDGKRRFDLFSITVAYVFNQYESKLFENTIFKSFLDSIDIF